MSSRIVTAALLVAATGALRLAPVARRAPRRVRASHLAMRLNPASFDGTALTITEFPMPVLRNPNGNVTAFDDAFRKTCAEMFSVMYQADGVGIAATQVGIDRRFFVYNPTGNADIPVCERVVANPRIFEYGPTTVVEDEGCLSSRSECCAGGVRRATWIWVEYDDERGKKRRAKLKDFEARVFQHEYDHIEGVLHVDRLDAADRARVQPTLDAMAAEYGPGGAVDLDPAKRDALVPPVPGRMPPATGALAAAPAKRKPPKKKAPAGFGAPKRKR